MPNVRPLNEKKYQISKHKFLELYHYCLQYNEWKDELKYKTDTVASPNYSGMPKGTEQTNATEALAIRRSLLSNKCEVIEQTAIEADSEIYQYILKAVTNEYVTYNYLKQVMSIPCGKNLYYNRRKKFYWLMSTKL